MCDNCGCNITDGNRELIMKGGKLEKTDGNKQTIKVLQDLLHENNHVAEHNRQHFSQHYVLTINLMSSPGAGKTSLLENTIQQIGSQYRMAVIEGDLETENDAERIRQLGTEAIQITTGSACHLDAHMIHQAIHQLDLEALDILFIENVGNLVCPASFDLGQHLNLAMLSTPEGDDKPAKYPVMFRAADIVLLSKCDLLSVLDDFDTDKARRYLHDIASTAPVLQVSSKSEHGMDLWYDWLEKQLSQHLHKQEQHQYIRSQPI